MTPAYHYDESELEQFVTATEAVRMLKTTRETMRKWLTTGVLPYRPNPGDRRKKLISVRDVERLRLLREEGKMVKAS